MAILERWQLVLCDFPGCSATTTANPSTPPTDWITDGGGMKWEYKCSGTYVVCDRHRPITCDELREALGIEP